MPDPTPEMIAENIVAWDALQAAVLGIRSTLNNPRECAAYVDAASQQLQILQGNVGLLIAEEEKKP